MISLSCQLPDAMQGIFLEVCLWCTCVCVHVFLRMLMSGERKSCCAYSPDPHSQAPCHAF